MEKQTHSKGPWALGWGKVVGPDDKAICMLTYRKDAWNGDLISAAPDMLDALSRLAAAMRENYDGENLYGDWIAIAEKAIAKAEGREASV